jgi:hypothetical protein
MQHVNPGNVPGSTELSCLAGRGGGFGCRINQEEVERIEARFRNEFPKLSIHFEMAKKSRVPAEVSILAAFFLLALTAVIPASVMYWLMRPTTLPNPGISAYRPPRPDSFVSSFAKEERDLHALTIAAAKRANEQLQLEVGAFASAQQAEGERSAPTKRQRPQRSVRARSRPAPSITAQQPGVPLNTVANRDHPFGTWYR